MHRLSAELFKGVDRRLDKILMTGVVAALMLLNLGCDECKSSADCSGGKVCMSGKCKTSDDGVDTDSDGVETDTGNSDTGTAVTEDSEDSAPPSDAGTDPETDTETGSEVADCVDPENDCPEAEACTAYTCRDGACVLAMQSGDPCGDADEPCVAHTCVAGVCTASPLSGTPCGSDDNDCTNDVCVSGVCEHRPLSGGACEDDGNPCTQDVCEQGICGVLLDGTSCDTDTNPCTDEICQVGVCTAVPLPERSPCDDGSWCNGSADRCIDGACVAPEGSAPCLGEGACVEVTCIEPADGETVGVCDRTVLSGDACDDGLFCNGTERCADGVCIHEDAPCRESLGVCMANACDETQDDCVAEPVTDGEPCLVQDGLLCNGTERCEAGGCILGAPFCPIFNDCTQNACIEGENGADPVCEGIVPANDGEPCDTTVACDGQGARYCLDGVCAHGETPACAPREQDGNLCTRYALCFEEDHQPVCAYEEDNMNGFGTVACGETVSFDTLSANNEVSTYEGTACAGSFDGGEAVVVIDLEDGGYTATLEVEGMTMDGEELRLFLVTDPCDAVNTCLDASTTTVSGNKPVGSADMHAIVIDGTNGNRGRGTITLTCDS